MTKWWKASFYFDTSFVFQEILNRLKLSPCERPNFRASLPRLQTVVKVVCMSKCFRASLARLWPEQSLRTVHWHLVAPWWEVKVGCCLEARTWALSSVSWRTFSCWHLVTPIEFKCQSCCFVHNTKPCDFPVTTNTENSDLSVSRAVRSTSWVQRKVVRSGSPWVHRNLGLKEGGCLLCCRVEATDSINLHCCASGSVKLRRRTCIFGKPRKPPRRRRWQLQSLTCRLLSASRTRPMYALASNPPEPTTWQSWHKLASRIPKKIPQACLAVQEK